MVLKYINLTIVMKANYMYFVIVNGCSKELIDREYPIGPYYMVEFEDKLRILSLGLSCIRAAMKSFFIFAFILLRHKPEHGPELVKQC